MLALFPMLLGTNYPQNYAEQSARPNMCVFCLMAFHVTNQLAYGPCMILGTSLSSYDSTLEATPLVRCHTCFVVHTREKFLLKLHFS